MNNVEKLFIIKEAIGFRPHIFRPFRPVPAPVNIGSKLPRSKLGPMGHMSPNAQKGHMGKIDAQLEKLGPIKQHIAARNAKQTLLKKLNDLGFTDQQGQAIKHLPGESAQHGVYFNNTKLTPGQVANLEKVPPNMLHPDDLDYFLNMGL